MLEKLRSDPVGLAALSHAQASALSNLGLVWSLLKSNSETSTPAKDCETAAVTQGVEIVGHSLSCEDVRGDARAGIAGMPAWLSCAATSVLPSEFELITVLM